MLSARSKCVSASAKLAVGGVPNSSLATLRLAQPRLAMPCAQRPSRWCADASAGLMSTASSHNSFTSYSDAMYLPAPEDHASVSDATGVERARRGPPAPTYALLPRISAAPCRMVPFHLAASPSRGFSSRACFTISSAFSSNSDLTLVFFLFASSLATSK